MSPAEPFEAASLILARDGSSGPLIYMVRRHPRSAFMANAHVFVGGRLDPADVEPEVQRRCSGLSAEQAAGRLGTDGARAIGLYVAAIRECFEEAGVLLADDPLPPPEELAEMRRRLAAKEASFAALLAERSLALALDRLRYLDRWCTPEVEPRRYDTRFFVCRAPEAQRPTCDPHETTSGEWLSAEDALERNRRHELVLPPPTLTLLERLRGKRSVQEILDAAPDAPMPCTTPRLLPGERPVLLLPGDHRFDDPSSPAGPEHYVVLRDGQWSRVCKQEAEPEQ
jgi:8-oxo-dGTP pyrophosphatase MutT (NUDIX family)